MLHGTKKLVNLFNGNKFQHTQTARSVKNKKNFDKLMRFYCKCLVVKQ